MSFEALTGKIVKVYRGGPESRVGQLLAAKSDYIALLTEKDGIVFYQQRHIKSITQHGKKDFPFRSAFLNDFTFTPPNSFKDVLRSLMNFKVKINRGGPEHVEGVLREVRCDFITVVTKDEVVRIMNEHIRSVSYQQRERSDKSEESSSNQQNNQSESSSSQRNNESSSHDSSSSSSSSRRGRRSRRGHSTKSNRFRIFW